MQVSEFQPVAAWLIPWLYRLFDEYKIETFRFFNVTDQWQRPSPTDQSVNVVNVFIRDDGSTVTSPVTVEQDFAITITTPDYKESDDIAASITSFLQTLPYDAATPVAAIHGINGPRPVQDDTYENVRYITATAVCTGTVKELDN